MNHLKILGDFDTTIQITVMVNGLSVPYTMKEDLVELNIDMNPGLSMLSIKLNSRGKFSITNLFLDGVSARQFLYLSYIQKLDGIWNPATDLQDIDETWYMPISNPMSLLLSTSYEKFDTLEVGKNLYSKYKIFYPESVLLDERFPKLVRDFFKYNYDYYVCNVDEFKKPLSNNLVPYFNFNYSFDTTNLAKELNDNKDYILSLSQTPGQIKFNRQEENYNADTDWKVIFAFPTLRTNKIENFLLDKEKLPNLYKFYSDLPFKKIYGSYIGYLPANGYVSPHRDCLQGAVPYGCSQFYFSIYSKPGNLFKLNKVGLVDIRKNPVVINNQTFTHSLVNQSNDCRWTISLFAEVFDDFYERYVYA